MTPTRPHRMALLPLAVLASSVLSLAGAVSASAGTAAGHFQLARADGPVVSSVVLPWSFPWSGCVNLDKRKGAYTTTAAPGTYAGKFTVYDGPDCRPNTCRGQVVAPGDRSGRSDYLFVIKESDIIEGSCR